MASKAKIVFLNSDFVIVNADVDSAIKALTGATGVVKFTTNKKVYDYSLNTINIGEKEQPKAYKIETVTVGINPDKVVRVEEAADDVATVNTGSAVADVAPAANEPTGH